MIVILILVIFLRILQYVVFFDVILSWLTLLGIRFRPKFLADIIDPIYKSVRKNMPTTLGPIDFTPIVVILLLFFVETLIAAIFNDLYREAIFYITNR